MSLQCALNLSTLAYAVGQTPAPMLALKVYNPNASAVVVTGVQISFWDTVGNRLVSPPVTPPMVPTGPGVPTVVPSLDSITMGPFPVVVQSAANGNASLMVPTSSQPPNMQVSQPLVFNLVIGATVLASDGSTNEASRVQLRVAPQSTPPMGYQGGAANFSDGDSANLVSALVG